MTTDVAIPQGERTFSYDAFLDVVGRQGITEDAAERMWADLAEPATGDVPSGAGLVRSPKRFAETPRLTRLVSVLLYVGAILVAGSYGWWAFQPGLGDAGLLALSLVYGAGFLAVALVAKRRGFDDLAAAGATIVAFYVPVAAYAALNLAGFEFKYEEDGIVAFYDWVDGGWIWLELAAIAGAAALYRVFRAPLLMLPLSLFALFLSMDGAARAFGLNFDDASDRTIGAFVLTFGLLAVTGGVLLDYRGFRRNAFWLHVFGALGIVSSFCWLFAEDSSYELALILSGVVMLLLGVWLARVLYLTVGGLALWSGISFLAPSPLVLTISGLALVGVAIWLSVSTSPLRRWLQTRPLPAPQRD